MIRPCQKTKKKKNRTKQKEKIKQTNKLWNMKVKVIPVVIGGPELSPKDCKTSKSEDNGRPFELQDYLEYWEAYSRCGTKAYERSIRWDSLV